MHICYLPGGRSVWEKTVPEVLSTARGNTIQYELDLAPAKQATRPARVRSIHVPLVLNNQEISK